MSEEEIEVDDEEKFQDAKNITPIVNLKRVLLLS
jgi:hypothetical protein